MTCIDLRDESDFSPTDSVCFFIELKLGSGYEPNYSTQP